MALDDFPKRRCSERLHSLYDLQMLLFGARSDSEIDTWEVVCRILERGESRKPYQEFQSPSRVEMEKQKSVHRGWCSNHRTHTPETKPFSPWVDQHSWLHPRMIV